MIRVLIRSALETKGFHDSCHRPPTSHVSVASAAASYASSFTDIRADLFAPLDRERAMLHGY